MAGASLSEAVLNLPEELRHLIYNLIDSGDNSRAIKLKYGGKPIFSTQNFSTIPLDVDASLEQDIRTVRGQHEKLVITNYDARDMGPVFDWARGFFSPKDVLESVKTIELKCVQLHYPPLLRSY